MDYFLHLIRTSARSLAKRPVFTLAAAFSLALGIGANTTIFTLINAVFFAPLPGDAPDRLVAVYSSEEDPSNDGVFNGFLSMSYPNFEDYRDDNETLEYMSTWHGTPFGLSGDGPPEQVRGEFVSGAYWDLWGIEPALGRFFGDSADVDGAESVAVIGHGLWQRRFGGDRGVLGQILRVNGRPLEIIGVAPEGFKGMEMAVSSEVWVPNGMFKQMARPPFPQFMDHRGGRFFFVIGRMKDDVTIREATADLAVVTSRFVEEHPRWNDGLGVRVLPMREVTINPNQRGTFVKAGWVLAAMVGLLLFVACSNVANLLLARADGRRKEIAIRLSIGAKRRQMIGQLMTESVLLSIFGAILALPIALWTLSILWNFDWMRDFHGQNLFGTESFDVALNWRVFLFTFAVAVVCGLLFGLVPALRGSKPDVVGELKEQTNPPQRVHRMLGFRNVLVAGQVALALVALIGAGLFVRSLAAAQAIDVGFESDDLMMLSFTPGLQGYPQEQTELFYDRVVEEIEAIPGVEIASLGEVAPLTVTFFRMFYPEGSSEDDAVRVTTNAVDEDYFDTLGIPIVSGRDFSDFDRADTQRVAVVNETLAKRYWSDRDPIGQRFYFNGEEAIEVIGVARDARYINLNEEPRPYIYLPMEQRFVAGATLHVRGNGEIDPEALLADVRREVQALDPDLPLVHVQTADSLLRGALSGPKTAAILLSIYGLLTLVLAAIGIYGIMSYNVGQRFREIGIRMAMGGRRRDIFKLVLQEGLVIALVGITFGLILAFAGNSLIASMLYGISATHLPTYLSICLVLVLIVLVASLFPAFRATRTDPLQALRYE